MRASFLRLQSRWRPLVAASCLAVFGGCDSLPRSVAPSAPEMPPPPAHPVRTAGDEAPQDLLAQGLAEADDWARGGHAPRSESVLPMERGRGCYRCNRRWYKAAAEHPTEFAGALASRNDPQLVFATVANVLIEFGDIAAVTVVRALDAHEPLWQEGMRALSESRDLPSVTTAAMIVHEIRRHVAEHAEDASLRAAVLSFAALLLAHERDRRVDPGDIPDALLHPAKLFDRQLSAADLERILARPRGWLDAATWCSAFAREPSLPRQLVAVTETRADAHDADLVDGGRAVLACLCSRPAPAARTELGRFFRRRAVDPMSADGTLAVDFEGSCR